MNRIRITILLTATMFITLVGCATNSSNDNKRSVKKITTASGEQLMVVESPNNIANIMRSLSVDKAKDFKLERSQIPTDQLNELDKFVAETMEVTDCKTLHVNGCNSCCADGVSGSLRVTTCGNFCDKVCGAEPCH